ncbi:50S ribosomal protein L11 methyltransferase [Flagellimonas flava]|uniref:Ribosomal protein L11 methyltransferase n=1 Tax=Flagellimonas flava TaxID=570519 RepID=A0A1M5HJW9_9FLAO|nr:50S ribosomal protein L11 methyltransferase [Allomuricauda flava]SHG16227.1 ribosomal protein L11 methyltransferase [Allomuricauda flava]
MGLTYIECHFKVKPVQPAVEILIAELGALGFESFVEEETGLRAYILESEWASDLLEQVHILQHQEFEIDWSQKKIKQQNWNAEWEKNFRPIKVGSQCMVRAPFHEKEPVEFDIIIEPKMSFGTGHHETTHMMLQHILDNDFDGKSVLDMGCGTGVLAILAKMKGAAYAEAIDIDEWCYLNTVENAERNHCSIEVFQGDVSLLAGKTFDIILANINRNILLEDIPAYAKSLNPKGSLFLSGFYSDDLDAISSKCTEHGLQFVKNFEKNKWVSAKYVN